MIGWDEIAPAHDAADVDRAALAARRVRRRSRGGTKLILSPANRLYLDMKYDGDTMLGLNWAGNVDGAAGVRLGSATAASGAGAADPRRSRRRSGPRRWRTSATSSSWRFRVWPPSPSWRGPRLPVTSGRRSSRDSRRNRRAGRRWASTSGACRRLPGGRGRRVRLTLSRKTVSRGGAEYAIRHFDAFGGMPKVHNEDRRRHSRDECSEPSARSLRLCV